MNPPPLRLYLSTNNRSQKFSIDMIPLYVSLNQPSLLIKDADSSKFISCKGLFSLKINLQILFDDFNETLKFDFAIQLSVRSMNYRLQREAISDDEDLLFSWIIKDLPSACDPLIRDRSQLIILCREASLVLLIGDCIISWRRRRQRPRHSESASGQWSLNPEIFSNYPGTRKLPS